MRSLRALALGAAATGVLAYAAAAVAAAIVQSGGGGLRVHLGPLVLVAVAQAEGTATTTFGPGLFVVGVLGGLANAAAAALLARRAR